LPPDATLRARISLVGRGAFAAARALKDTRTWIPEVLPLMRRLGVDSIPIASFLAVFTGIVLALLARYIFTGAVPHYFVGTLVTKAVLMELGPVLVAGRTVGANVALLGTMKVTEQVVALGLCPSVPRLPGRAGRRGAGHVPRRDAIWVGVSGGPPRAARHRYHHVREGARLFYVFRTWYTW
jgi:hypothetical protein